MAACVLLRFHLSFCICLKRPNCNFSHSASSDIIMFWWQRLSKIDNNHPRGRVSQCYRKYLRGNRCPSHYKSICNTRATSSDTCWTGASTLTQNTDVSGYILEQKTEARYYFLVVKGNIEGQILWPWWVGLIKETCFHSSAVHAGTSKQNRILKTFLKFILQI